MKNEDRIKWPKLNANRYMDQVTDQFKIYVEQLRDGHSEMIEETLDPSFLEIREKELQFTNPVVIKGEVYLADEMLVLHMDIKTCAQIPCIICNEPVKVEIVINGLYHAVPLSEVKSGVYNFKELLRETILLDTPSLTECDQGHCPQRKELQKYLKKEQHPSDEGYRPFANFGDD